MPRGMRCTILPKLSHSQSLTSDVRFPFTYNQAIGEIPIIFYELFSTEAFIGNCTTRKLSPSIFSLFVFDIPTRRVAAKVFE